MNPAVQASIISALVVIIIALMGVVWKMFERIVRVEAQSEHNKDKIKEVEDRRHRYQVEAQHKYDDLRDFIDKHILEAFRK